MLIELNDETINFCSVSVSSSNIEILNEEDYILNYDNHQYTKITKEIIYEDFLENVFLFNHNLRNFKIKYPKDNKTVFYTKISENAPWSLTIYDDGTQTEMEIDLDNPEHRDISERYMLEDNVIDIFYNHLGDIPFVKKNEDINFKTIKDTLIEDLENMYNEDFLEIITIQYALKNEFSNIIIEEFTPNIIEDGTKLANFHKHVFENINIFKKYKTVEDSIQALFLKKTLKIELSSLKKYNSLFNSKIPMPGLYLYKYMVNYLRLLNQKSIPPRILKKRGRKPKKKPEDGEQITEAGKEEKTND